MTASPIIAQRVGVGSMNTFTVNAQTASVKALLKLSAGGTSMTNLDDLMRRLASGELAAEHEAIALKPVHELTPRDIDLIVANQRIARLRWESGVKAPKAKPKAFVDLSSVIGVLAPKPVGSLRRR